MYHIIQPSVWAGAGVCDIDLPALLLLSNKRNTDECDLDIQRTTE
jgi:hypothetical protein